MSAAPHAGPPRRTFWRAFLRLYALGLLGVATLPLVAIPLLQARGLPPEAPSLPVLAALAMVQPSLLLAAAVAIGIRLAPAVGLRSYLAEGVALRELLARLRRAAPLAAGLGVACALLLAAADALVFRPLLPDFFAKVERMQTVGPAGLGGLLVGVLYGGITEELLMRWGLMTLLVWVGWRVLQRRRGVPSRGVLWMAIALAAVTFAAGHLPAAAAIEPLSAAQVARIGLLNALPGMLFGWLYARHALEAAMLAHASVHVGFLAVGLASTLD